MLGQYKLPRLGTWLEWDYRDRNCGRLGIMELERRPNDRLLFNKSGGDRAKEKK